MKIEIRNCPSTLAGSFETYSQEAVKKLFDGESVSPLLDFNLDERKISENVSASLNRISVSGVQEKFPAVIDSGKIRIAEIGERSTHILKPSPWDATISFRKEIPANENLTMQIASQVYGISTAANGLCFSKNGQQIYITRRFDISSEGRKFNMEDFSVLIGKNEHLLGTYFKYDGCYADIAKVIRQMSSEAENDLVRFFNILVFNYIYANGDAHLKNFSLIFDYDNKCKLSPAYDLLNTNLHVKDNDFALDGGLSSEIEKSDIYISSGHPCRLDFERFGTFIGLSASDIKSVLDHYMNIPKRSTQLISNSFLSEKMKRNYLRIIEERTKRFIRKSE